MPYFETSDSTRLYYRDWGTGQPVVFISSWGLNSEMWEYQMLPLSEQGCRCIAPDRRGHGRSDDPGRGYDFDTFADDLETIMDKLDLRDVTLVGHSMGCGEIARYLSKCGTSRIKRVMLVSSSIFLGMADVPAEARGFIEETVKLLLTDRPQYLNSGAYKFFALGSKWPAPPSVSPDMRAQGDYIMMQASLKALVDCWRAMWNTDFRPDMAAFTVPTLVIHGDNDQNATLEMCGKPLAQAIAGSQLKIYEGAPHGLFYTDRARLASDILAFVQG